MLREPYEDSDTVAIVKKKRLKWIGHLVRMDRRRLVKRNTRRVEIGYKATKGTEYFVPLETSAVLTDEYYVIANSEELIGTTE
jgi:hypothetical protein